MMIYCCGFGVLNSFYFVIYFIEIMKKLFILFPMLSLLVLCWCSNLWERVICTRDDWTQFIQMVIWETNERVIRIDEYTNQANVIRKSDWNKWSNCNLIWE
jgi:hypothetical protein